ncbi:MAG: ribosome biogenesis GTPase YlqF [Firmicutes bacterium]|nr:ribosome biogenesis GTPase YlqF [Bacillota bacterium]
MPGTEIQWFPGHMARTRRQIKERLALVDAVIEILDARIPYSSRNPEITKLLSGKPTLTVLNKSGLADTSKTDAWVSYFKNRGQTVPLPIDCVTGAGISKITPTITEMLSEKIKRREAKGMTGRHIRVMIVGIPNVGKSTLINRLAGERRAKAENRPGVTQRQQWIATKTGLDLLDTPGVLWHKFDERRVGENLAFTGAIKDAILDTETLAAALLGRLRETYPELLRERYKLEQIPSRDELSDFELMNLIGKKRGFLVSGGEVSSERTANMLLDEFRAAKIGRITLETPVSTARGTLCD